MQVQEGQVDFTKLGTPTFVISSLARYGIKQFASMVAPILPQVPDCNILTSLLCKYV